MALLNASPAGDPPVNEPPKTPDTPPPAPPEAGTRPDWVPEAAWKDGAVDMEALGAHVGTLGKQTDVPATADAYTLPAIDGFDAETAAASPLFKSLMDGAYKNGVGQAAFDGIIGEYVTQETTRSAAIEAAERAKLGPNAEDRTKAVAAWVTASLPADQAAAVMAGATNAAAVQGLEKLMNARAAPTPRDPPPPPKTRETREEIDKIMASDAYSGPKNKRDDAVIAKVTAWFDAEYAADQAKK